MRNNQSFWKRVFSDVKEDIFESLVGFIFFIFASFGFFSLFSDTFPHLSTLDKISLFITYGFLATFTAWFSLAFSRNLNINNKIIQLLILFIIYSVLALSQTFSILFFNPSIIKLSYFTSITIGIFWFISLAKQLNNYLNGDKIDLIFINRELRDEVNYLEEQLSDYEKKSTLTPEQIKTNKLQSLLIKDKNTLNRIDNTTQKVLKRGNFNLLMGLFFAIVGIGFLVFFIYLDFQGVSVVSKDETLTQTLLHIFPKFSLIAIIEICAIFFINLYKKSLIEERFYQNELTNLETKFLALELAFHTEKDDLIDKAIENLLTTERNPQVQETKDSKENSKDKEDKILQIIMKLLDKVDKK